MTGGKATFLEKTLICYGLKFFSGPHVSRRAIGVRKGGFQGSKPPLEEWFSVIYTVHGNK